MKKSIALILSASILVLSGCTGFQMSTGIGYRKVPPEVNKPILQSIEPIEKVLKFSFSPEQVDFLLSFLKSEAFENFIQAALPKDNRVDVGLWCEIKIEHENDELQKN